MTTLGGVPMAEQFSIRDLQCDPLRIDAALGEGAALCFEPAELRKLRRPLSRMTYGPGTLLLARQIAERIERGGSALVSLDTLESLMMQAGPALRGDVQAAKGETLAPILVLVLAFACSQRGFNASFDLDGPQGHGRITVTTQGRALLIARAGAEQQAA